MYELSKTTVALINEHIQRFDTRMETITESIKVAAQEYADALSVDPAARDMFAAAYPTYPSSVWSGFIRIAAGDMHESLLFDGTSGGRALLKCPYDVQEHYIDNPVSMVTSDGEMLNVSVSKLTGNQVNQVFASGCVRDVAEQRAWIESQKTAAAINKKVKIDKTNGIYVKGTYLHVGEIRLSRAELLKYLGQMD